MRRDWQCHKRLPFCDLGPRSCLPELQFPLTLFVELSLAFGWAWNGEVRLTDRLELTGWAIQKCLCGVEVIDRFFVDDR